MALSDVHLGPCTVSYGGTDLGRTTGGVVFTYTPTFFDFSADQYTSMETSFLTAEACQAAVPLAESSIDNLALVIPQGTKSTSGSAKRLDVGGGTVTTSDLLPLILTPTMTETGANQKVTIWKALPKEAIELGFNKDGVRTVAVMFHGYRDSSKASGKELFTLGDTTV